MEKKSYVTKEETQGGGINQEFTTNTDTVESLDSFEPLEELFEKAKSPSGLNNIFYRESGSDTKIITYITH